MADVERQETVRPEDRERFEAWKSGPLARIINDFAKETGAVGGDEPIRNFGVRVAACGEKALATLRETFGCAADGTFAAAMGGSLKDACVLQMTSAMNAALPHGYPYLAAFAFSDPTPQLRMAVTRREAVPGAHDMVRKDNVIILRIKNVALGRTTEIAYLKTTDVDYTHPGDSLEALFPQERRSL